LAVTGMSNALGTLPPLRELIDAAHGVGAFGLIDGAQLVPHQAVNVSELGCDFLTFSGHKMLGPTASGGLYGTAELLDAMDPFLGGGEMIMEVFPDHSTYKEPPLKFEAGTMNIAQEVGLAASRPRPGHRSTSTTRRKTSTPCSTGSRRRRRSSASRLDGGDNRNRRNAWHSTISTRKRSSTTTRAPGTNGTSRAQSSRARG